VRIWPENNDIVFQTSLSLQSQAIQAATKSKWSHMGMIFIIKGQPYVLEAAATVTFTPLKTWINRGKGKRYEAKRLKEREKHITPVTISAIMKMVKNYKGKPYDPVFSWTDNKMYCSELVWKIYYKSLGIRLGELERLGDFDLRPPLVRQKLKERYGKHIPLNEQVISPEQIYRSELLEAVK
jgi:hypothetical protein